MLPVFLLRVRLPLLLLASGGCAYQEVEMIVPVTGQQELVRASHHEALPLDNTRIQCRMTPRTGPNDYVCGTPSYWHHRSRRRTGTTPTERWGVPTPTN